MTDEGEQPAQSEPPTPAPTQRETDTPSWFSAWKTGEWQVVPKVDLSEAYAAVRSRAKALRRRRIISSVLASVVMAGLFTVLGVYYVSSIPLPDALSLPATTTVYYSDGTTVMARLGTQRRVMVDVRTLPSYVASAVVAAEDPAYWLDSSTLISRQYARAASGLADSSAAAQARLLVMSWKLEDSYDKQQILGFYLNTVYFGRGSYGIEAAARSYFGKAAASLSVAEAIVLAGMIESPGDGKYDPTVDPIAARARFGVIADRMVSIEAIDSATAAGLRVPRVNAYDPGVLASDLDRPTGLVVAQVLAELRAHEPFRGKAPGYLEDGGFSIITTIDPRVQSLVEETADETVAGSAMAGQPRNLQAAAVVVEPGTGRVLGYFGGHNGAGADYAGSYPDASGKTAGYGAHPPGQTFDVYTLAAALDEGISVKSRWDSPATKQFPTSGRDAANPVEDVLTVPCQPTCTLAEATNESLNVPFFALTERVGSADVIDMARAAGITEMWVPDSTAGPRERVDLIEQGGSSVSPDPFGTEVGLGDYPVTVLDQANAMATFASGGRRAQAHFVRQVREGGRVVYGEQLSSAGPRVLSEKAVDDLSWTLSQNPAGQLPDGRPSATKSGVGRLRSSALETAHAWLIGYTPNLALAVWIGNESDELPLKDKTGARVAGAGLPAEIYRTVMAKAHERLGLTRTEFTPPTFTGDATVGDGPPA